MNGNTASQTSTDTDDQFRFSQIPEWLLDSSASPAAIYLYCVLQRYADKHGLCHPSRSTIASRMGVTAPTVDRAKKELVALGALVVKHRSSDSGDPTSNEYLINFYAPFGEGGSKKSLPPQSNNLATGSKKNRAQRITSKNDIWDQSKKTDPRESIGQAAAGIRDRELLPECNDCGNTGWLDSEGGVVKCHCERAGISA